MVEEFVVVPFGMLTTLLSTAGVIQFSKTYTSTTLDTMGVSDIDR